MDLPKYEDLVPVTQAATPSDDDPLPKYDDLVSPDEDGKSTIERAITNKLALTAGIARGATLGGSDLALTKSGLVQPETLNNLKEQAPVSSEAGNMIGGGAVVGATGGLTGLLPETAGLAAKIGTIAAEGGAFGAGNSVSEYALGDDTALNSQKVLANIGMGAALGAGLGTFTESILPPALKKASQLASAIKGITESTEGAATSAISPENIVSDVPSFNGKKPKTLDDVKKIVSDAKYQGLDESLPQQPVLKAAASRNPLAVPITDMQHAALSSADSWDNYRLQKEETPILKDLEGVQKKAALNQMDLAIDSIAPDGTSAESDAQKNGEIARDYLRNAYKEEQKSSGELVKQAKSYDTEGFDHRSGIVDAMSKDIPSIGNMAKITDDGIIEVQPYDAGMGIPKDVYNNLKPVFESLNKNPSDFETLFNLRGAIDDGMNPITTKSTTLGMARKLKSSMMQYMQGMVDENMPALQDGFRRYAINEEKRGVIQKAFGVDINDVQPHEVGKPTENVTNKIFRNSETASAAKAILPKDKYNHILSNFLAQGRDANTSAEGIFSTRKFQKFLDSHAPALSDAFADNPDALQKIRDINVQSMIIPDAATINPSGSATTLMRAMKHFGDADGLVGISKGVLALLKEESLGRYENRIKNFNINEQLQGRAGKATVLSEMGKIIEKTNNKISSGAKSIFNSDAGRGAALSGASKYLTENYDKNEKKIRNFANNPDKLMDHMVAHTDSLYEHAPNITQGLHNSMTASVQFLNSKLPKPSYELPLSQKWEPTNAQKYKFGQYYEAVNDPTIALKQVKDGSLTNETMEALAATQPHLLEEMQKKVMENMQQKKGVNLNYATKISLSKFLQQPLDDGMLPQVLASNQAAFASPPPQSGQPKPRASQSKNINLSSRYATATQSDQQEKS